MSKRCSHDMYVQNCDGCRIAELEAEVERLLEKQNWCNKESLKICKEHLKTIAELEAAVLREKRRVDSLHQCINGRDAQLAEMRQVLKSAPPPREYETVRAGRIVTDPLPPDSVAYGNWFKRIKALAGGRDE